MSLSLGGTPPLSVGEFKFIYDPATPKEAWCLNDHTFVKGPDHLWHVFGITHIKPLDFFKDPGLRLDHATAHTLLQSPWHKEDFAVTVDTKKYNEHLFWAPHVVFDKGLYHLFVCTGAAQGHTYAIHRLVSKDLWHWERTEPRPVLVDGFDGRDPMVIRDGNRWILYYCATSEPEGGHHIVAAMANRFSSALATHS